MYDPDANIDDFFGYDVTISGDFAAVGARQQDEDAMGLNSMSDAGAAYIFDVNEPNTLPPINTLSVLENDFEADIKAYPNPIENRLNIDLKQIRNDIVISIYNVLGQQVLSKNYRDEESVSLDLKQPKGVYILKVTVDSKYTSTFKIIKS